MVLDHEDDRKHLLMLIETAQVPGAAVLIVAGLIQRIQSASVASSFEPVAPPITQESARALADAGYMPIDAYVRLCQEQGWTADTSQSK